ncbi:condensation domain-containing protein [Butyrivibrio sp. AE3009]|uniref:condensation domain-containing protein n=1 Tax=Butyrivibrio sp. AE3009 TaxID=1280666 RepID=UPI0003B72FC1|nr:condensation domain-containing protein [Butyrivibrio sp. AE3009]
MEKLYPLTAAQNMHYNWIRQYHTQQVSGLSIVAAVQLELDFGLLHKCINEETKRYDCLNLRFTEPDENGEIRQYFKRKVLKNIKILNLSSMSLEEADNVLQTMAYDALDGNDRAMYEFLMVMLPQGFNGFFVHLDHRLLDSCGLAVMVKDIMALYAHYAYGKDYPEELARFEQMLAVDLAKASNVKRRARDEAFWQEQMDKYGEPLYSDITGPGVLEASRKAHGDPSLRAADIETENLFVAVKDYKLEPEATRRVLDFCREKRISFNNLLLLTMRSYLSKVNGGQEDITIESFIARRATRDEWTSGGSRTIMFPCRTVISGDTSFLDAAMQIQATQNNIYLHSSYDPELIRKALRKRYGTPKDTTYVSCYLTYQPLQVDADALDLSGIPLYFKWFANGAATKKVYLTVTHTQDGGLNFSYHYQTAALCEHDMELFYYYMMRIMFAGISDPLAAIAAIQIGV